MRLRYRRYRAGRRCLVALGLVAAAVFHGIVIARLFLSPEQFRFRAENLLQSYFTGRVSLGAAGYELPLGFRLAEIGLLRAEKLGGGQLFRAKSLRVQCRLIPLLRGNVVVDDLVVEQPELFLTPKDLAKVEQPSREVPEAPVQRIILRGGRALLAADVLFGGSPAQELREVNVELTKAGRLDNAFEFEGSAASDLWGRCDLEGTVDLKARRLDVLAVARGVAIDERLRKLLPAAYLRAVDRYDVQGMVDLTVRASVDRGSDTPPALTASIELRGCEATYERFPVHCTDIRGSIVFDGTNIYYRDIQGRAGPTSFEVSGQTSGEKVETHLVVRDRPLDATLYEAVCKARTPDGRYALKDTWDRCGIQGGMLDLDYQSTWFRKERRFQAKVRSQVRDARATYGHFPYPLSGIVGTLRWEERVTYIERLSGRRGNATVQITGQVTDRGVPDLRIQAIDLPLDDTLRKALPPRWRKTFDELRPQGRAAADVRVTCPSGDPKKLEYRLTIRPEGASFQHKDSPHRIDDVRGDIVVDETGSVSFRNLRGRLGSIPVKFLGTVAATPDGPRLDLTVLAEEVDLGPAARALIGKQAGVAYDALAPRGKVRVAWKLVTDPKTGRRQDSTEIDCLQDCSIQHAQFPVRITSLMGRALVEQDGRTTFTGMKGRIGRAAVEALEGMYVPGKGHGLRFTLRARGMMLDDGIRRAAPGSWQKIWDDVRPSGEVDVEYRFEANPKDPEHPFQRVSIEPANAAFCYRRLPVPVSDVTRGKVSFDQDGNATLSNVQGKVRGRTVQLSGKVQAGPKGGTLHLDVNAAELELDAGLRRALPEEWQRVFDQLQLSGTIGADATVQADLATGAASAFRLDATLKGCAATWPKLPVPLKGLRGRVKYENGVATLSDVAGQAAVGEQLQLDGQIGVSAGAASRVHLRWRNVRFTPELRKALPKGFCKGLDDLAFKGAVDLDLTVTSPGDDKKATECFGVVGLRDCSFRRSYAFEQVSGDVRIDKGAFEPNGAHALAGSLRLRKLVVREFAVTGLEGQFSYRAGDKGGEPRVSFEALEGGFYGGRATATLRTGLHDGGASETLVWLNGVDFKEFLEKGVRTKYRASGVLQLRLEFPPGRFKEEKGLIGDGRAEVRAGELGQLPLAVALFSLLRLAAPDRSLSKAEMRFGVADKHLVVKELLLGRDDSLLTRGSGTVDFGGNVNMTFITPKRGLIQNVLGLGLDSLVRYEVQGTVTEPKPNARALPITQGLLDEFRRGFGIWKALSPRRPASKP